MADKPVDKTTLPLLIPQNPSFVGFSGQSRIAVHREQVDRIMEVFLQMLPSNYVSLVTGPLYTVKFQAVAEAIADIQLTAQEAFADSDYDYMRPEFLFQMLGSLVFPDATTDGYPNLRGDLTYRDFLKKMVGLLLQGATQATVEGGLDLLTDATWSVISKVIAAREEKKKVWNKEHGTWEEVSGAYWGLDDQFEFEVNVSYLDPDTGSQQLPVDAFVLQENTRIVLRALKPAHTLYEYRHLLKETFGPLFDDTVSWSFDDYNYEDFRKFCCGAREVIGAAGVTWTDRTLFSDTTRDFGQIQVGADLTITSGPNSIDSGGVEGTVASTDMRHVGRYRVVEVRSFPIGTDTTPRAYTTSPTGLTGTATVQDDTIEDVNQDFGTAVEGETVTFAEGPNAGTYRLKTLLGLYGGPVGPTVGPATKVRISPSLLRLDRRMGSSATGQAYSVSVDRLGVKVPHTVTGEDASIYFAI